MAGVPPAPSMFEQPRLTLVLHGGVVRTTGSLTWLHVWKARIYTYANGEMAQFGDRELPSWYALRVPEWFNNYEKVKDKPSYRLYAPIAEWSPFSVPKFGPLVEHVVVVSQHSSSGATPTFKFELLLAYHAPIQCTVNRAQVVRATKLFGYASSPMCTHLNKTLPEKIETFYDLERVAAWKAAPSTSRTVRYVTEIVRYATLPNFFYAMAPHVPLAVLFLSQRVMLRRDLLDFVESTPTSMCFELARRADLQSIVGHEHLWRVGDGSTLVEWLARVRWTASRWAAEDPCAIHPTKEVIARVASLIEPPPPPPKKGGRPRKVAVQPTIHEQALLASQAQPLDYWQAATNLAAGFATLWRATGNLSANVAQDAAWRAATPLTRQLVLAYGGFAQSEVLAPLELDSTGNIVESGKAAAAPAPKDAKEDETLPIRFPSTESLEFMWASVLRRVMTSGEHVASKRGYVSLAHTYDDDDHAADEPVAEFPRGYVTLVNAQRPDYGHVIKTLVGEQPHLITKTVLMAPTLCGVNALREAGFPGACSIQDFNAGELAEAAGRARVVIVDQAHRLTLHDVVYMSARLGLLNSNGAVEPPLSKVPLKHEIRLVFVGNPDAPSDRDGLVFQSMWRSRELFTESRTISVTPVVTSASEPAFQVLGETVPGDIGDMRAGKFPCDASIRIIDSRNPLTAILSVFTGHVASTIRGDGYHEARAYEVNYRNEANQNIQIYTRNAPGLKRMTSALSEPRTSLRVGNRVLVRDVGLVEPLVRACVSTDYLPFHHVDFKEAPVLYARSTCHYFRVDHMDHAKCCPDLKNSKLQQHESRCQHVGRTSTHDIASAAVLLLRECPQVSVPYVVLYVCEKTTRQDMFYALSKATRKIIFVSDSMANIQKAYGRNCFLYSTSLESTLNSVFSSVHYAFAPIAVPQLLVPPPEPEVKKKSTPKARAAKKSRMDDGSDDDDDDEDSEEYSVDEDDDDDSDSDISYDDESDDEDEVEEDGEDESSLNATTTTRPKRKRASISKPRKQPPQRKPTKPRRSSRQPEASTQNMLLEEDCFEWQGAQPCT